MKKEKQAIIYFDNQCLLCSRLLQFVFRKDKHALFLFAPYSFITMRKDHYGPFPDSILLEMNGKLFYRSDAILQILQHLGYPLKILSLFRFLPRTLRDWIYNFTAKNRVVFKRDYCMLPSGKLSERFIKAL